MNALRRLYMARPVFLNVPLEAQQRLSTDTTKSLQSQSPLFKSSHFQDSLIHPWSIIHARYMATKKSKGKRKGGASKMELSVGDGVLELRPVENNMKSVVERYKEELRQKYSIKVTDGILDNIKVTIDNQKFHLYEVASVSSNTKEFSITPMLDGSNVIKEMVGSLSQSDLQLNPRVENDIIKVPVPLSSLDRQESLVKSAKAAGETTKTNIRKIRQQTTKQLSRAKTSKDTERLILTQIDLLSEKYISEIDDAFSKKQKELKSE